LTLKKCKFTIPSYSIHNTKNYSTQDEVESYPVPTWSAAKGIFESVVRFETVEIVPSMVEVCTPVVFHNYVTNYGGPLRESAVMPHGSYQLLATVLINICYRLYAEIIPVEHNRKLSEKALKLGCLLILKSGILSHHAEICSPDLHRSTQI
jgi:hypothetical protein